jgi:hypothetical protein
MLKVLMKALMKAMVEALMKVMVTAMVSNDKGWGTSGGNNSYWTTAGPPHTTSGPIRISAPRRIGMWQGEV